MRDLYETYVKRISEATAIRDSNFAEITKAYQEKVNRAYADMTGAMEMRISSLLNGPQEPADNGPKNAARTVGTEAVKKSLLPVDKEFSSDRGMKSAWSEPDAD